MTRFAEIAHVYFLEEPIFDCPGQPFLQMEEKQENLWICVPHLPRGSSPEATVTMIGEILESFFEKRDCGNFIFWYYTPMALPFSETFKPAMTVYDCMDELSGFKFAPEGIRQNERQLLERADVVFTGGTSLYEAKKSSHNNIHPFPSSIDKAHFGTARGGQAEPQDQAAITGIKLGFYGVLDERLDQELIRDIATRRPDWHIVLIGPVVKIDPAELPQADNIHYMGPRSYQLLPAYLSGWDVALIPFLLNESTRFISPTKTPEYLAAGKPVVSSPIRDVVYPYEEIGLFSIANDADTFITAIEKELTHAADPHWMHAVDEFLSDKSWEHTFSAMVKLMMKVQKPERPVVPVTKLKNAS
ncbi:glycosyltransferase [Dyadobacter soli]|nr:glycosyltransferase [Dyadobacter soli]